MAEAGEPEEGTVDEGASDGESGAGGATPDVAATAPRNRREFAPPKPAKEFAPPNPEDVAPSWTRWVMFAVALMFLALGGVLCVAAVYGFGAKFGPGGWTAIYDVAQNARALSLLLLTAATFLVFGAMVGTIGVVLGPTINRVGGLLVVVVSAWVIGSASLAYMRWRDVHAPPTIRRPPPPVGTTPSA